MNEQEKNDRMRALVGIAGQQTQLPPGQGPLTDNERFELNAYRAKAKLECDVYLSSARSMQHDNRAWPRDNGPSMAEMQRAQNVNLHARELPGKDAKDWANAYEQARANNANRPPLLRIICKIAARLLFVILLVGVAVAVMV